VFTDKIVKTGIVFLTKTKKELGLYINLNEIDSSTPQ